MKILKMIDFCSTGVHLKIKGDTIKRSSLGGFISLLIILAVLFLTIYLGLDIVMKEKPILIISEFESPTPTYYNFTAKDFMFGFIVVNGYLEKLDYENYLDITISNYVSQIKDNVKEGEIPYSSEIKEYTEFETCDKVEEYKNMNISSSILKTYTCIKNLTLFIGGDYTDKACGTFDFIVKPCQDKPTCKSDEEIRSLMNSGISFAIYYRDHLIDPKKSDTPIQTIHTPLVFGLSDLFQLNVNFYYTNLLVISDFGFLFEDLDTTKTFKFEEKEIIYRSRGEGYYMWATMYLNKKTSTYERRYLKVQEIAADIGGLFKFMWIIGSLFMYPISNKLINLDLMNEVFNFQPYGVEVNNKRKPFSSQYKILLDNKNEINIKNYSNDNNDIQEPDISDVRNAKKIDNNKSNDYSTENKACLNLNNNESNKEKISNNLEKSNYSKFINNSTFPINSQHNMISELKDTSKITPILFINNDKDYQSQSNGVNNNKYFIDNKNSVEKIESLKKMSKYIIIV